MDCFIFVIAVCYNTSLFLPFDKKTSMAICPNCGKKVTTIKKKIENSHFCISAYTCDSCGTCFKEISNPSFRTI
jgi:predicted RNA-binding Zn-ribbon protein involved in translation (DUF1610 family)